VHQVLLGLYPLIKQKVSLRDLPGRRRRIDTYDWMSRSRRSNDWLKLDLSFVEATNNHE
jgi:hypothetical protein